MSFPNLEIVSLSMKNVEIINYYKYEILLHCLIGPPDQIIVIFVSVTKCEHVCKTGQNLTKYE